MRYKYWLPALVVCFFVPASQAQNFFKEMAKDLLTPQQQLAPNNAVAAGNTSLPPGQYVMTNLNSGQGFYVFVAPNGQMLAQDPRTVQLQLIPLQAQSQQPGAPVQQQQGGVGGLMRGALNNYLQGQGGGGQ